MALVSATARCYQTRMNARSEQLTLELPGLRLAAQAWGNKDGRPVLALHGWLDSSASFATLAPLLPSSLRLVALDLAGHGHSAHRPLGSYEFVQWIPDVFAVAECLGWREFALLGHSLGAAVAICAAGTLPERITRVALLDGLGPLTQKEDETPGRLAGAIRARLLQQRPRDRTEPTGPRATYPNLDAMCERLMQAVAGLDAAAARVLVQRSAETIDGGYRWRYDPRLRQRSLLRLTEPQVHAFMATVRSPTLLVRARQGWPFDRELIAARRASLRHSQLLEIDGPHHVHLVNPETVAPALTDFLMA